MGEDFNSKINARVSVVESKLDNHNDRLEGLEDKNSKITRLDTLMEMLLESNKEQTITLREINLNLNNLNKGYENLDKRMEVLENNHNEIKTNSNINLAKLAKDIIFKVVPMIILTWILIQLGLSKA